MKTEELLRNNEGTIIDVRTRGEFMGGNVTGSLNIPLNEIPQRIEELKKMKTPLIFCCVSGNRSGQAASYVSRHGVDCVNGGSWLEVNYLVSQEAQ